MSRYRRLVPAPMRALIKAHRLPRPNWYIGSGESGSFDPSRVRVTPEMRREIDDLTARIAARHE